MPAFLFKGEISPYHPSVWFSGTDFSVHLSRLTEKKRQNGLICSHYSPPLAVGAVGKNASACSAFFLLLTVEAFRKYEKVIMNNKKFRRNFNLNYSLFIIHYSLFTLLSWK